ncbi:PepSY-like domain-containing protein [Mucilaginibacter sp. JRF]|uniref:PepSY-like domain-containing protein n=1 Tax=Mucilaginibacter sp. JRF TaxID=2780088 RepID=UPI001881EDAB|nr:PepSY-like domain-containing protein [Mucilaginibacter sp. JRF]MBE9583791.1 PepSY-like domain-containing protein [Mucilaginibacter sp. JRF]
MKKTFLLGAALLLCAPSFAQKAIVVPAAVKSTFTKSFPNAKAVKWSKENDAEFEAEFTNGSVKQAANFKTSGTLVVTETEIKKSALPAVITAVVNKEFTGYKIEDIEKVEKPGKPRYYEMKVEKGEQSYLIEISPEGKILKKEKEGKEEKDSD